MISSPPRFLSSSSNAITTIILILVAILLLFSSTSISALKFTVTLTKSAPTFSTSFSPRRIYLNLKFYFSDSTVLTGTKKANITLTAASELIANNKMIRNTEWTNTGTYDAASNSLTATISSPIDSYLSYENDAFDAFRRLEITIPSGKRAWVDHADATISFEKIKIKYKEETYKTYAAALSQCQDINNGFLMSFLRPYERSDILDSLNTAKEWWTGSLLADQRPSNSFLCYKTDPDYIASECKNQGAYAQFYVTNANTAFCSRPAGFTCQGTAAFDFDGNAAGAISEYTGRWQYSGGWRVIDRTKDYSFAHVCLEFDSYKSEKPSTLVVVIVEGETPTKTRTKTRSFSISVSTTKSISATFTSSGSASITATATGSSTLSFSANETLTVTRSLSKKTFSVSFSPNETRSGSGSESQRSSSLSSSTNETLTTSLSIPQTNSETRILTATRTLPPTRTRTFSRRTPSRSSSVSEVATGESHTASDSRSIDGLTPSRQITFSRTVPLPPVKPVPFFGGGVDTIAVLAAALGGASVAAVARSRLMSALALSKCGSGEGLTDDLDFLDNPFGLKFGSEILQSQRGAAFGNFYVMVAFGALMMLVAALVAWKTERTFWRSMERCRMPGLMMLVLQILTPGTAQATSALWKYGVYFSDITLSIFSSVTIVFGPLLLVLLVTAPGMCKAVLYPLPVRTAEVEDDKKNGNNNSSSDDDDDDGEEVGVNLSEFLNSENQNKGVSALENSSPKRRKKNKKFSCTWKSISRSLYSVYAFLLVPTRDWFDQDLPPPTMPRDFVTIRPDERTAGFAGSWVLKYGVIWEDFDNAMFGFFDLITSTILGGTAGFAAGVLPRPDCLFLLATATMACGGHLFYLIIKRCCLTRAMMTWMVLNSLFTFLMVLFSTIMFLGQALDFGALSSAMLDAQTFTAILTTLLQFFQLIVFFAEAYDAFRRGKEQKENTTRNANFNNFLDDLLEDDVEEMNDIDLGDFLNGAGEFQEEQEEEEPEPEPAEEEIDVSQFLIPDEDEPPPQEIEPSIVVVPSTTYDLEEDDDGENVVRLDDEDLLDGETLLDADGKAIGSAHRANAEQYEQLQQLLGKKSKK